MQFVYRDPSEAQAKLMDTHNLGGHGPHTSFDTRKYMAQYKERMKPYILAALKAGVHPANIVTVPAYCVGDIGHHIAQSAFNMFKDDMAFGIYESVMQAFKNTLYRGLEDERVQGPLRRAVRRHGRSRPAPAPTSCGRTASPCPWLSTC